jgi:hypothetical protein
VYGHARYYLYLIGAADPIADGFPGSVMISNVLQGYFRETIEILFGFYRK